MSATDINSVVIIGRLVRDAELKYTGKGQALCSFSIAVNKSYTGNDGEKHEKANFFNCTVWGKLAEIVPKYCSKGHRICVLGRLDQDTWEDKDGKQRSAVKIVADNVQFLQGKSEEKAQQEDEKDSCVSYEPQGAPVSDEDIPF